MLFFNPTLGRWGRLAWATAASIFLHVVVLMDSMGVVLLPSAQIRPAEVGVTKSLMVFFSLRQSSPLPFVENEEKRSFVDAKALEQSEHELAGEMRGEPKQSPTPDQFLTRDRISVPAQPLSEINIPWPPGLPVMGVRSAVFTVFIDELGRVSDVVPDGHTLSPVMEEVARNAFLSASFRPALLNGKAVKSMKRIEVEFEFLPAPVPEDAPSVVSRKELL